MNGAGAWKSCKKEYKINLKLDGAKSVLRLKGEGVGRAISEFKS